LNEKFAKGEITVEQVVSKAIEILKTPEGAEAVGTFFANIGMAGISSAALAKLTKDGVYLVRGFLNLYKESVAIRTGLALDGGVLISNVGDALPGFGIPKYYTYTSSAGTNIYVTPHAMKHLEELFANGRKNGSKYLSLIGRIHQRAINSAIEDVLSRGPIVYNKMYYSGGNEIMFGAPRKAGELPAVIHFK
jgi:hypothetical protein